MTIEELKELKTKLIKESEVKQQIRRELSSCFIPNEYYHRGTTQKEIIAREQKKRFLRGLKQALTQVNTQMRIEESDKRCVL